VIAPEKIAAIEAALAAFDVFAMVDNPDGNEAGSVSKVPGDPVLALPLKMRLIMDPDNADGFGFGDGAPRMFYVEARRILTDDELDELYAAALADEWPA